MLAPSAITIVRRRKPDRGLAGIMAPPSSVRKLLRKGMFKEFDYAAGDQAVDSAHLPGAMADGAVATDFITDQPGFHRGA
jgi:hypothetical protein